MRRVRRRFWLLFTIVCLIFISECVCTVSACASPIPPRERLIQSLCGNVLSSKEKSTVELFAVCCDDSPAVRDLRIEIKDAFGARVLKIEPAENAGYSPSLILADFTGGDTEQIFLGIDSGGSGGFGYYNVYGVNGGVTETLFSGTQTGESYTADYADGYKVEIKNRLSGACFSADISCYSADYLDKLYTADGLLIRPVPAVVWGVNTVFPFYNSSVKKYCLETFCPVSGLCRADGIGNMINLLAHDGDRFSSYFESFAVSRSSCG